MTKEIELKTCPRSVTGSYQVENWRESEVRWPHLVQCDFPLPAKVGLVDLLIGVDFADLHYSFVDIRGKVGEPVAWLGPLSRTCIAYFGKESGSLGPKSPCKRLWDCLGERRSECSDDSKVLTEQNSNKVEVIERGQSNRVKLRKEDVPGAILHREIAAAMASLPWS